MRLRVCILLTVFVSLTTEAATLGEVRETLAKMRCETMFYVPLLAPPIEPRKITIPSLWGTFKNSGLRAAVAQFGSAGTARQKFETLMAGYNEAVGALQKARERATRDFDIYSRPTTLVHGSVQDLWDQALETGKKAIATAPSADAVSRALDKAKNAAIALRDYSRDLGVAEGAALARLNDYSRRRWGQDLKAEVGPIIAQATAEVRNASSPQAIDLILQSATDRLEPKWVALQAEIRERRQREMRFDINENGNSEGILNAFLSFQPREKIEQTTGSDASQQQQIIIDGASIQAIVMYMEQNKQAVKAFVYKEVQTLRLMAQFAASNGNEENRRRIEEGIATRWTNDFQALSASVYPIQRVTELKLLRQYVTQLSRPAEFRVVVRPERARRLSILEREIIVTDALQSKELQFTVFQAAIPLKTGLVRPTPPQEEKITRPAYSANPRTKGEYERALAARNRYMADLQGARNDYVTAVEKYNNTDIPNYNRRKAELNAAVERRRAARQVFLTYLGVRHPHIFTTPNALERIRHNVTVRSSYASSYGYGSPSWRRAYERARSQAAQRRLSKAPVVADDGDSFPDFSFFEDFFDLFPAWIADEAYARTQLHFDYMTYSTEQNSQRDLREVLDDVPARYSEDLLRRQRDRVLEDIGPINMPIIYAIPEGLEIPPPTDGDGNPIDEPLGPINPSEIDASGVTEIERNDLNGAPIDPVALDDGPMQVAELEPLDVPKPFAELNIELPPEPERPPEPRSSSSGSYSSSVGTVSGGSSAGDDDSERQKPAAYEAPAQTYQAPAQPDSSPSFDSSSSPSGGSPE